MNLTLGDLNALNAFGQMVYGVRGKEKEKGGDGFVGAIVDRHGTPRVIKMLCTGPCSWE